MSKFQVTQAIKQQRLQTKNLILVPYGKHLVPNYHKWMQSDELCAQTDSIKLSLEDEFIAQQCWMDDETKLTFIVCELSKYESTTGDSNEKEAQSMIGDINLFFNEKGDDDVPKIYAELSVMIANQQSRRKGYGIEAVLAVMNYVQQTFPQPPALIAIIGEQNSPSLRMFENKLGFKQFKFMKAFQQFKFIFEFDDELQKTIFKKLSDQIDFKILK